MYGVRIKRHTIARTVVRGGGVCNNSDFTCVHFRQGRLEVAVSYPNTHRSRSFHGDDFVDFHIIEEK